MDLQVEEEPGDGVPKGSGFGTSVPPNELAIVQLGESIPFD